MSLRPSVCSCSGAVLSPLGRSSFFCSVSAFPLCGRSLPLTRFSTVLCADLFRNSPSSGAGLLSQPSVISPSLPTAALCPTFLAPRSSSLLPVPFLRLPRFPAVSLWCVVFLSAGPGPFSTFIFSHAKASLTPTRVWTFFRHTPSRHTVGHLILFIRRGSTPRLVPGLSSTTGGFSTQGRPQRFCVKASFSAPGGLYSASPSLGVGDFLSPARFSHPGSSPAFPSPGLFSCPAPFLSLVVSLLNSVVSFPFFSCKLRGDVSGHT